MKAYYNIYEYEVDEDKFQEIFVKHNDGKRMGNAALRNSDALNLGREGFNIYQSYASARVVTNSGKIEGHSVGMADVVKFHGKPSR